MPLKLYWNFVSLIRYIFPPKVQQTLIPLTYFCMVNELKVLFLKGCKQSKSRICNRECSLEI